MGRPSARSKARGSGKGDRRASRGAIVFIVLLILAVIAASIGIWWILTPHPPKPGPGPGPGPAQPSAQPADCPDVQVLLIPGTWETTAGDNPYAPHPPNGDALLLHVRDPLVKAYGPASSAPLGPVPGVRAQVYTLPYVAQFSNPVAIPPDGQQSYDASRRQGTDRARDEMVKLYQHCPLTRYILAGFSQGAVIAGDLAADIGAGHGPVPADLVLGVTLVADGRRDPAQSTAVGANPGGLGAEIVLQPFSMISGAFGTTMTGRRASGFGTLTPRVFSICAPGDPICVAPTNVGGISSMVAAMQNPVHARYASYVVDGNGTTTPQWIANWAQRLINDAPRPPHLPN